MTMGRHRTFDLHIVRVGRCRFGTSNLQRCCHLLKYEGKSYRLKEASKGLALEKKNN